jgi:hypothetical protein
MNSVSGRVDLAYGFELLQRRTRTRTTVKRDAVAFAGQRPSVARPKTRQPRMRGRKRAPPQEAGGSLESFAVPFRDISEFCRGPLSQILLEQD